MPDEPTPDQIPPGFKLRHTIHEHKWTVSYLAWSPDGRMLAFAGHDGDIQLWDAASGLPRDAIKLLKWWQGRSGEVPDSRAVMDMSWSPNGKTLACAAADGRIRILDVESGHVSRVLKGHPGFVRGVAWSPDGVLLASVDYDGLMLWDAETWELADTLEPRSLVVRAVGLLRGHAEVWPSSPFLGVAWEPNGRMLACGAGDGVWLLDTWVLDDEVGQLRPTCLSQVEGVITDLAWSPDGKTLTAAINTTVLLWDMATHRVTKLEGHTGPVTRVAFSPDGHLASKSNDGTVRLWRGDTGENLATLGWSPRRTSSGLAFHPKLPLLATVGRDGRIIHVWELDCDVILSEASRRENVLYTTAKVTLVGDSGTGKTGLGWRLAHGEFREHASTHGQQFWVIDELGATRGDGTQCEAVLWDLAGQPDYRLIHALFLDDVDLALVLFDPTNRQEPLKGVEYWLKQLRRERRDGRRRRVLLVGARADRGVPTMTREELEEFCRKQGVEAYMGTSALTGEGLGELLARVKSSIVWDEMPATVTTRTFKRVKEFVLALKAEPERKGVLVSPAELRGRLEATDAAWEFADAEMMTAVRHLSNHGYVSVLRGSSGEETILLAPDLLVNLASSFVLEARRNPKGLGALEEARVLAGGYEFPELASLEETERDVLLDAAVVLFIEHNLCFRETLGTQTLLIFPALINQKRPVLEEAETLEDVSYRVTGAVENVYAALVVQLGYTNTFTRTNQWQNQAEYETARGDVCGFRQVDEREGETELVIYYAKEKGGARLLFQGLFEEFLRGRDVDVTKFPPVQCPKCGYRQQRTEVVKRIGEGKGFLFCGECGKKIALPKEGERVALSAAERTQLGEEQTRTRRRTAFESALVRVKAVVRDEKKKTPSCFVSYAWGDEGQERWVRRLAKHLENAGVDVVLDQKDNPQPGANVARFVGLIEKSDFVVVVGTPLYRRKYENRVSAAGSVVAAEVDLINLRLTGTEEEKATVLPLLLEGDGRTSFPPLVRGKVYGNFAEDEMYFPSLFDLILTLYRIPFGHPAVNDLRDSLRAGVGRRR